LGAIARKYVRNKYGRTTSPLHGGLATDRLVAEWWLRSARVEAVIQDRPAEHAANPVRIRVPANIGELKRTDAHAAEEIQSKVREQFEKWFAQGYAVTGFELDAEAGTYLLEPYVRSLSED